MRFIGRSSLLFLAPLVLVAVRGAALLKSISNDVQTSPRADAWMPETFPFPTYFAVDVTKANFGVTVGNSFVDFLVINFYVPSDSKCQDFSLQYERVAQAFNDPGQQSTEVLIGRIDCEAEAKLCEFFGIKWFPKVMGGSPKDWKTAWIMDLGDDGIFDEDRGEDPLQYFEQYGVDQALRGYDRATSVKSMSVAQCAASCVERLWCQSFDWSSQEEDGFCHLAEVNMDQMTDPQDALVSWEGASYWQRTSGNLMDFSSVFRAARQGDAPLQGLMQMINGNTKQDVVMESIDSFVSVLKAKQAGMELGPIDATASGTMLLSETRANLWDIETATAIALYSAWVKASDPWAQEALEDFVEALCEMYPETSCRPAFCALRVSMHDLFGRTGLEAGADLMGGWKMCGRREWNSYRVGWQSCRGSLPNTRGLDCGLWLLFHSLTASAQHNLQAVNAVRAIHGYVSHFILSQEYRDTFNNIIGAKLDASTHKRDIVMNLWLAHNTINRIVQTRDKLALAQDLFTGDPAFPHLQWPPQALCSNCSNADGKFDFGRTYSFMLSFFGPSSGVFKDPPAHSSPEGFASQMAAPDSTAGGGSGDGMPSSPKGDMSWDDGGSPFADEISDEEEVANMNGGDYSPTGNYATSDASASDASTKTAFQECQQLATDRECVFCDTATCTEHIEMFVTSEEHRHDLELMCVHCVEEDEVAEYNAYRSSLNHHQVGGLLAFLVGFTMLSALLYSCVQEHKDASRIPLHQQYGQV